MTIKPEIISGAMIGGLIFVSFLYQKDNVNCILVSIPYYETKKTAICETHSEGVSDLLADELKAQSDLFRLL